MGFHIFLRVYYPNRKKIYNFATYIINEYIKGQKNYHRLWYIDMISLLSALVWQV